MFDRLNENARRVIFFARYEASQRNQPSIALEDMVLGVLRKITTELIDWNITNALEIMDSIRSVLPVEGRNGGIDLPLSNEAKLAVQNATNLTSGHVTPWHLLLIMYPLVNQNIREILESNGITLERIKERI
ncbi:MAG: hypothetical protein ACYCZW_00910 [Minisyncoccota bacterium]